MITHRIGGFCLIAAAASTLTAELTRSDHSEGSYAAQLADVTASRTPELIAAVLFLLAAILLIPAAIGIATLAQGQGTRLISSGSILLGIAALWLAAGRAMFCFILYALTASGVSTDTANAALTRIGNSAAFAPFLLTLVALLIGPIALGIGLWRVGRAHWWPAVAWSLGAVVFLANDTTRLGDIVGFGAMTIALATLGLTSTRSHLITIDAPSVISPAAESTI